MKIWQEINTYPKMNEEIKKLLEFKWDEISLYALKRIDNLETLVHDYSVLAEINHLTL